MEGRDAGTVVLPNAELKVFMTASPEVRAQRRLDELRARGQTATAEEVLRNLEHRDKLDTGREMAPLRKAEGAVEIDTSDLNFEQQVNKIVALAKDVINS